MGSVSGEVPRAVVPIICQAEDCDPWSEAETKARDFLQVLRYDFYSLTVLKNNTAGMLKES